jgi:hypothetical protein
MLTKHTDANNQQPLPTRDSAASAPKRIRPWATLRRAALLEVLVIVLIALVVDSLWFDGNRFAAATPHPLWLLVLAMSVQYGLAEGLLAAALCSAFLLVGNMPAADPHQDPIDYIWHLSQQPLQWVAGALLCGGLRQRQIRERDELLTQLNEAKEHRSRIHLAYDRLKHAKEQLDVRLATRANLATHAFEAVLAMVQSDGPQRDAAIASLVREWTAAQVFSIFILDGDVLRLRYSSGWSAEALYPREYRSDSELFRKIMDDHTRLLITVPSDAVELGHEGLLAGPLVDLQNNNVVGMLKIERVAFLDLGTEMVERFDTLCSWIGTALGSRLESVASTTQRPAGSGNARGAEETVRMKLEFMHQLSQRIGFEVSVISISPQLTNDLKPAARVLLQSALKAALSRLRKADRALPLDTRGHGAVVLLAGTSPAQAERVARKIRLATVRNLPETLRHIPFNVQVRKLGQLLSRNAA